MAVVSKYKQLRSSDTSYLEALDKGKLYEIYVLSQLVMDLSRRGFRLAFSHSSLIFKGAPGKINANDPHFLVRPPQGPTCRLFVDIEFETLGVQLPNQAHTSDLSSHHELDLAVVDTSQSYPVPAEVLLAVECKAVAILKKSLIREALGLRRELSLLRPPTSSSLTRRGGSPPIKVPADPPSEMWFAFADPAGNNYQCSPSQFGIEFRHLPLP